MVDDSLMRAGSSSDERSENRVFNYQTRAGEGGREPRHQAGQIDPLNLTWTGRGESESSSLSSISLAAAGPHRAGNALRSGRHRDEVESLTRTRAQERLQKNDYGCHARREQRREGRRKEAQRARSVDLLVLAREVSRGKLEVGRVGSVETGCSGVGGCRRDGGQG